MGGDLDAERSSVMPIELWWWIKPLILTGGVSMFVFIPVAIVVDKVHSNCLAAKILSAVAVAPWIVGGLAVACWFVLNMLISIWR